MSKVYLARSRLRKLEAKESLPNKLIKLLIEAGIEDIIQKGNIVAIKVHIGDMSNSGYRYIRPIFVRRVVDLVRSLGGIPFITDTWGLKHVESAVKNGFNYATLNASVIPANGIKENFYYMVKVPDAFHIKEIQVAGNIYDADVLINFAHSKGHPSSGYGGAIKNIAMGCTSYKTRGDIHNLEKLDNIGEKFQEGLVDATKAVLRNKKGKAIHIDYIMDVQPMCDCAPYSDNPIVPDIGIAVSTDIVALEKAALDLIDNAPPAPYSIAEKLGLKPGDNKFFKIHRKDPYIQVRAGERAGLGTQKYELIEI